MDSTLRGGPGRHRRLASGQLPQWQPDPQRRGQSVRPSRAEFHPVGGPTGAISPTILLATVSFYGGSFLITCFQRL